MTDYRWSKNKSKTGYYENSGKSTPADASVHNIWLKTSRRVKWCEWNSGAWTVTRSPPWSTSMDTSNNTLEKPCTTAEPLQQSKPFSQVCWAEAATDDIYCYVSTKSCKIMLCFYFWTIFPVLTFMYESELTFPMFQNVLNSSVKAQHSKQTWFMW